MAAQARTKQLEQVTRELAIALAHLIPVVDDANRVLALTAQDEGNDGLFDELGENRDFLDVTRARTLAALDVVAPHVARELRRDDELT